MKPQFKTELSIGSSGWVDDLHALTAPLGEEFWSRFTPCPLAELTRVEREIGRSLPTDFVDFYTTIGYGEFLPFGMRWGWFDSPDEILGNIGVAISFVLGSYFRGSEWCTSDEHRRLWLSRGRDNPIPSKFTDDTLAIGKGIRLYDLLQFGGDGCCCYHQLHIPLSPSKVAYCLLTDGQTVENETPTFSAGLEFILANYLRIE